MNKYAFTLAEILITLLIIGVVASIVVPNLINDIQDQQYKVAWKKAYAEISQVMEKLKIDNGGTLRNLCNYVDTSCIVNNFLQYISTTRVCQSNASGLCMQLPYTYIGTISSGLGGVTDSGSSVFFLSNGSSFLVRWHSQDCTFDSNNNKCGWILVDTNSQKGPNRLGKDVFGISILENKLLPWGADYAYADDYNDCISTGNGYSCAAKYLYN